MRHRLVIKDSAGEYHYSASGEMDDAELEGMLKLANNPDQLTNIRITKADGTVCGFRREHIIFFGIEPIEE